MKLFNLTIILFFVFVFNANSQNIKYFRKYIFERSTYELEMICPVDSTIINKINCYAVNYDKFNRITQLTYLKKGKIAEFANWAKMKIEYINNFQNMSYFDLYDKPTLNMNRIHKRSIQRDFNAKKIIEKCYNKEGKLSPDEDEVSMYIYSLDSKNRIVKEQYSKNGSFITNKDHCLFVTYKWDEDTKNLIQHIKFHYQSKVDIKNKNSRIIKIFDKKNHLPLKETVYKVENDSIEYGISCFEYDSFGNVIKYHYNNPNEENSVILSSCICKYDKYGNILENYTKNIIKFYNWENYSNEKSPYKKEHSGIKTEYDSLENIIRTSNYNFDDKLENYKTGIAISEYKYDNKNRKIEEIRYDNQYQLIKNDPCIIKWTYNDNDDKIEESNWDSNNQLKGNSLDIAIIRWEYDNNHNIINTDYFDTNKKKLLE